MEARKRVERQMERFKVCEKETKTKAFSKEGLGQATKVDPREKARNEAREWINTTVDCLNVEARACRRTAGLSAPLALSCPWLADAWLCVQIEAHDAEIERLQNGKKKAKPPPRLAHLEESALRHKAHVARLEQIMRLLDNEVRPSPAMPWLPHVDAVCRALARAGAEPRGDRGGARDGGRLPGAP